jgi:toxin YoeB
MYKIIFSKQAGKDAKKIESSGLKPKVVELLKLIKKDPYLYPPEYEFLEGKMKGSISRKINKQHRLVYEVLSKDTIRVLRMWTHYE